MLPTYRCVAVGGTFDLLHKGHKVLLSQPFRLGKEIVIGLTSDEFASKLGKVLQHSYDERLNVLQNFLNANFPNRRYEIWKLDDYFGPAIFLEKVDAIVVSEETSTRVEMANTERKRRGIPPLKVEVVEIVKAEDGGPISTSRIRSNEIDLDGQLLVK